MLDEYQVPIIAFVWRPEEIIPSVTQMAHRTGSSAIFDFSMMETQALHSFLRKAAPACRVEDIKISACHLNGSIFGAAAEGNRSPEHLGRMPPPVFSGRILPAFYRD